MIEWLLKLCSPLQEHSTTVYHSHRPCSERWDHAEIVKYWLPTFQCDLPREPHQSHDHRLLHCVGCSQLLFPIQTQRFWLWIFCLLLSSMSSKGNQLLTSCSHRAPSFSFSTSSRHSLASAKFFLFWMDVLEVDEYTLLVPFEVILVAL